MEWSGLISNLVGRLIQVGGGRIRLHTLYDNSIFEGLVVSTCTIMDSDKNRIILEPWIQVNVSMVQEINRNLVGIQNITIPFLVVNEDQIYYETINNYWDIFLPNDIVYPGTQIFGTFSFGPEKMSTLVFILGKMIPETTYFKVIIKQNNKLCHGYLEFYIKGSNIIFKFLATTDSKHVLFMPISALYYQTVEL
jgi:hypothetical protein